MLVGQLAVVVGDRVERDEGVAHVVRDDRAQELDVLLRVGSLRLDVGEGPHQLAVHVLEPPWQQSVLLHHVLAELGDGRVLVARQRVEWRRAEGVQVEEVLRRLFHPAGGAPQVGIDRVLGDEGAVLDEERPDRGRQQVDGAAGDQPVRFEAPGGGSFGGEGDRRQHGQGEQGGTD